MSAISLNFRNVLSCLYLSLSLSVSPGSADSFLNHLLSPVVVPPSSEEPSSPGASEPAALRRPAGLAGSDLLAEIRAKQEKRASITPKHVSDVLGGGGDNR